MKLNSMWICTLIMHSKNTIRHMLCNGFCGLVVFVSFLMISFSCVKKVYFVLSYERKLHAFAFFSAWYVQADL